MRKLFFYLAATVTLAVLAVAFNACSNELDTVKNGDNTFALRSTSADAYDEAANKPVQTVSGDIWWEQRWTNDKVWEIDGIVTVRGLGKLIIDPGTFIKAKPRTDGSATGVLVVSQDNQLIANGTDQQPIVFTSYKKLDKDPVTVAKAGDFGGIILLGRAPVNTPDTYRWIEGLQEGNPFYRYGGNNAADNSGSLRYVRIEYAGYELEPANEVNGLTCGGVGSGTTLDHIQVSWGLDDSFEFFGGTVNPSYLISYAPDDDNFDFDNGYRGTLTYGLALANPASSHSKSGGKSDSNGIELDNNAKKQDDQFSLTPKTHPTLNYVTIVGTETKVQNTGGNFTGDAYKWGARIRRGGEITIKNSIITGYPKGFVVDTDANKALSSFQNCAFHGFDAVFAPLPLPAGIATTVGSPAAKFGMANPFYPGLDFTGNSTKGAFALDPFWAEDWSSFN